MSIRRVIKLLGNIGDVALKHSKADNPFFKEKTAKLGEEIRDRLLDGLTKGYDINGNQFKGLKESTLEIRRYRGISGSTPLRANDGIVNFVRSPDFIQTESLQVKLKSPSGYMEAQNEGFTPKKIPFVHERLDKLYFLPNKKGISVPARKWFGIPKTYQEGGTKYNKFLNKLVDAYNDMFDAAIRKG